MGHFVVSFIFLVGCSFSAYSMEESEADSRSDYEREESEGNQRSIPRTRKNALKSISSLDDLEISICSLCEANIIDSSLGCGHKFCEKCITGWMVKLLDVKGGPTCPKCMKPFTHITAVNPAPAAHVMLSDEEEVAHLETLIKQNNLKAKEKDRMQEPRSAPPSRHAKIQKSVRKKEEERESFLDWLFSPSPTRRKPLSPKTKKLLLTI